jgi:hypothetical protein
MTKHYVVLMGAVLVAAILTIVDPAPSKADDDNSNNPVTGVGLSLFFRNTAMAPITFVGNPGRYLQEIDIVSTSVPGSVDAGVQPLITNGGDLAGLDWTGVHQVEETTTKAANGTFTRVRYYRGANWMTRLSTFTLRAMDAAGTWIGTPITADAGFDNHISEDQDDGWVRRFVARQTATLCPTATSCTGATFVAQGLVQFRDALRPNRVTQVLPANAVAMELRWSQSTHVYRVGLNHAATTAFPYGYGFKPQLQAVTSPANGSFYMPGNQVQLRITLSDGAGHRLHPAGSLPTYAAADGVNGGSDPSGIHYYNPKLNPQLYYALKHRESNSLVALAGPTDKMTTPKELAPIDVCTPAQVVTASAAVDGFSALIVGFPPFRVTRCAADPTTPVSDIVTFTIPTDARPGTYIAALKARREFGGEALARGAILDLQVGSANTTPAASKVGKCQECHQGRSDFTVILHGLPDRRPCAACHNGSTFIGAYDVRVHTIHDRSNRFDENVQDCEVCHRDRPVGPARGIVIHTGAAQRDN